MFQCTNTVYSLCGAGGLSRAAVVGKERAFRNVSVLEPLRGKGGASVLQCYRPAPSLRTL